MLTADEWSALILSVKVSLWCVAVILPPGVALGWLLARHQFRGKALIEAVAHLPMVLPPVVTGYVLLLAFGRHGWLGRWLESFGLSLAFSWKGAVLASAAMSFP